MREYLKQRLAREATELNGDFLASGHLPEAESLQPAAVLVPLVDRPDGMTVLLTQRTTHLAHHAGQISFPGGRAETHDRSPIETALRETEEEIGLHRRHVEIIGCIDRYQTITGFLVTPVVGFVTPPFELRLDSFEVAEAFEVPLSFILNPQHHQRHQTTYQNQARSYYVIPYQQRCIWGATAAMLVNLAQKVSYAE